MISFVMKRQANSLTFWLKMGTFQDDQFCDKKASLKPYFLAKNGHFSR